MIINKVDKRTLERLDDEDWGLKKTHLTPIPAKTLIKLGKCCGNKCLNCPYEPEHTPGNKVISSPYL